MSPTVQGPVLWKCHVRKFFPDAASNEIAIIYPDRGMRWGKDDESNPREAGAVIGN